MESFLEKTAKYIITKHKSSIEKICIVLPSKRASLFLKHHFAKEIKKTIWSPNILSIEDFISELSGINTLDNISLLFELFEVHKQIAKSKSQEFDEFAKWGQILLHDFNEIDLHLASADKLFNYLADIKTLSSWNPEHLEPTEFQKQYISFFKSLHNYYKLFNEKLKNKKASYIGQAYKYVSENIQKIEKSLKWGNIYFIGFNALTRAEENILFKLKDSGIAEILWDSDAFYLNKNKNGIYHEAGYFIRKYLKKYINIEEFKWIENHFRDSEKNIHIYGVPKQIGQAKLCGQILENNPEIIASGFKSAIVLADENLLFPILNSLPGVDKLNATMGIPLTSTTSFELIKSIINLHLKSEFHTNTDHKNQNIFYRDDIKKILNHSLFFELSEQLFQCSPKEYNQFINLFTKTKRTYFSEQQLTEIKKNLGDTSNIFELIFSKWKADTTNILNNIKAILSEIKDALISKQPLSNVDLNIEIEYIFQLSIIINKLANYQDKYKAIKSLKSLFSLFNQICKIDKIALFGQPLEGMQLMGMLETRTLDFENIILCSVNENILPSSGKQNSFIPFDIKREFKLPTYREKNAIFAYHFFRLLQRAKNIHLLYNTESDPIAGGDKSRFLLQLIDEFKDYNPKLIVEEKIVESLLTLKKQQQISIQKTDSILDALHKKAEKGFSPSSLSSFIKCPLQFYYKEIVKIGENRETDDTIDAAILGQVIHDTLQEIYKPIVKQKITIEYLERQLTKINPLLNSSFQKLYSEGNVQFGKNLLITKIANYFIKNFIKTEINIIKEGSKIFIKSLEKNYQINFQITNSKGLSQTVNLKGIIDRIDEKDGMIRIIDYKTGSVNKTDLKFNLDKEQGWGELFTNYKKEKCFQLLFYAYLFNKHSQNDITITAGIYSLKKMSQDYIKLVLPNKEEINSEQLLKFEKGLKHLVEKIFNTKNNFTQTKNLKVCEFCDFKIICNR
jgi:hypothetical protein